MMHARIKSDWHWPHFAAPLCGEVDDRLRLGLPEHYLPGRLDAAIEAAHRALCGEPAADLLSVAGDPGQNLATRIAAGNQLALVGDPRITVYAPDMIDLPGGEFRMGLEWSAVDEVMSRLEGLGLERAWIEKECPRHPRRIEAFRIARFAVTNHEFRAYLLDTGAAELPSSWTFRRYPLERANHPVYTVSAQAAAAYAAWLGRRTGRRFRLPTEAEWEFAAAGTDGREYPWGETFDAERANTAESGLFSTTSVGVHLGGESCFGVADMAGNVEEYVADHYAPYAGGRAVCDHLVQLNGNYHVARGGSFARFRDLARTRRRHGHNPRSATYAMGFRLAESL